MIHLSLPCAGLRLEITSQCPNECHKESWTGKVGNMNVIPSNTTTSYKIYRDNNHPSYLLLPLIYGVIFIIGFATGNQPKDMLLSANMIAVGTIAYNVLVVHSGTMINFRMLRAKKKETLLSLISLAALPVPLLPGPCSQSIRSWPYFRG